MKQWKPLFTDDLNAVYNKQVVKFARIYKNNSFENYPIRLHGPEHSIHQLEVDLFSGRKVAGLMKSLTDHRADALSTAHSGEVSPQSCHWQCRITHPSTVNFC